MTLDMVTTAPAAYAGLDRQFIAGIWRDGAAGRKLIDTAPYDGTKLGEFTLASRADVDTAYAAAAQAQTAWAEALPAARAALLERVIGVLDARREEIIAWIIRESGSTRLKATIEISSARAICAEAATFPNRLEGRILASAIPAQDSRVYRAPLGVVGVISPWNFPFHLSMRSVAPALVLGNAVVLKPASDTPVSGGTLLGRIFEEAGLPSGLLSVVVGAGSEIGDHFVEHPVPRFISFTGSTEVGRRVGALATGGRWIKRVALELGGNAPLVVLDDADIDAAAAAACFGRFLHQGQICMSTNRVIVMDAVYDAFVAALKPKVEALVIGDPDDFATAIGPIINAAQVASVSEKLARAKADGARVLVGADPRGNIVPPQLLIDVDPDWEIAKDETFGPILPVIRARDEAHALELANASEFGLSSAVFTRDHSRGLRFARGIVVGMCHINDITVDDQVNAPFGGEKNSGLGRFNGEWAIEEFTRMQWVTIQHAPRHFPF